MSRFLPYTPDQVYLLPPTIKEVLPAGHLCFFIEQMVRRLNLEAFEQAYSEEGGSLYHPALMLSVWLYAYATGITSARELERRIVEDLPLRHLAGGAHPDHWALSAFRRRHPRAMNDVFTQVVEFVREQGLGKLGLVAVDGTPMQANNSKDRVDTVKGLRERRAKYRRWIRQWQKRCDAAENAVVAQYASEQMEKVEKKLESLPGRLQELKKSGLERRPRTDPDARVMKKRGKSVVGYTGEIAVSEDHFVVGKRVTQQSTENASLLPLVEEVKTNCGTAPEKVLGDAGLYSNDNVRELNKDGIDAYVPDSNLAAALNRGGRIKGRARAAEMKSMRAKFRTLQGRMLYARRKGIVEGPFGTIKAQRDMRQFRLRGLEKVSIEFTMVLLGYNLTRLHQELDQNSELWRRRRVKEKSNKKQQPVAKHYHRNCRIRYLGPIRDVRIPVAA